MLILLTSYPKSGNTWVRRFLSCYALNRRVALNELAAYAPIDADKRLWQNWLGFDPPGSSTAPLGMRKLFFIRLTQKIKGQYLFLKTHTAKLCYKGQPLFPEPYLKKVVHIVRHPAHVLFSLAHHYDLEPSAAWDMMCNDRFTIVNDEQFHQVVTSWKSHTLSWVSMRRDRRYIMIRYEDLVADPYSMFKLLVEHLDMKFNEARLNRAIEMSSFSCLQSEEQEGFIEAIPGKRFFRRGPVRGLPSGYGSLISKVQRDTQDICQRLSLKSL